MKLVDLSPRFIAAVGRSGQAVSFECPHCRTTRLAVAFANPIDGGTPMPTGRAGGNFKAMCEILWNDRDKTIGQDIVPPGFLWQRTGETFETLTLSPSVDCSSSGHWHGFVQGGEIR